MTNGNAPAFFLSYARAPISDANEFVKEFFDDLCRDVSQLIAVKPGDPTGFMDRSLEAGTQWEAELLKMVGTCKVFVALLSEPYLYRSKWCAMEWDLFSQRKVTRRPNAGGSSFSHAILPVVWAPLARPTPFRVNQVQRFVPDLPERYVALYQSEGILGAKKMDTDAYKAMVWKLGREIQKTVASYHVSSIMMQKSDGLRRTFRRSA